MQNLEELIEESVIDENFLNFLTDKIKSFNGEANRDKIFLFAKEILELIGQKDLISYKSSFEERLKNLKNSLSLSDLLEIAVKENKDMEFLNFYRGIPIKSKAEILEFEEDVAVFRTNELQLMAMKIAKRVFILKGDLFIQNLRAEVDTVNFINSTVTLKNLRYYFDTSFYKKIENLMVEPKFPLHIECIKELTKKEAWIDRMGEGELSFITKSGDFQKGDILNVLPLFLNREDLSFKVKIDERYFYEDYFHYRGIMQLDEELKNTFKNLINKIKEDAKRELKEELSYYLA